MPRTYSTLKKAISAKLKTPRDQSHILETLPTVYQTERLLNCSLKMDL
jgi:hypothetical protein